MLTTASSIAHPYTGNAGSQMPAFRCGLVYMCKEGFLCSITAGRVEERSRISILGLHLSRDGIILHKIYGMGFSGRLRVYLN